MKKPTFFLASAFFLAGCAALMSVQVASWVLDGISVLTTERVIADDGASLIAQKDCTIWRGIKGEAICTDAESAILLALKAKSGDNALDAETFTPADEPEFTAPAEGIAAGAHPVAGVGAETASRIRHDHGPAADVTEFVDAWAYLQGLGTAKPAAVAAMDSPDPATLADFETAAGAAESGEQTAALDLPPSESFGLDSSRFAAAKAAWRLSVTAANDDTPLATASGGGETAIGAATPGSEAWKTAEAGSEPLGKPVFGLYFVIGSLSRVADTGGFSKRRWQLGSQVVVTRLDGRELYREVAGPFPRSQREAVRSRLIQAGVRDAWLAFLEPALWRLVPPARVEETLAATERQIATLPR
jgi:hypothetical protein